MGDVTNMSWLGRRVRALDAERRTKKHEGGIISSKMFWIRAGALLGCIYIGIRYIVHCSLIFSLLLHRVCVQTLVPLYQASDQESPAPPESSKTRFVLRATVEVIWTEGSAELVLSQYEIAEETAGNGTYRETDGADQVPEPNMPSQHAERRDVPPLLRF